MCFSCIHWSEPSLSIEPPAVREVVHSPKPPKERKSRSCCTMSNRSSWLVPPQMDKPGLGYIEPRNAYRQPAWRNHFVACTGEFVGTYLFLLFAFLGHSTAVYQASATGPDGLHTNETLMYIALSYGFSLLVNAWTMYRVSGGLFNPAVTLGLVLGGGLSAVRGLLFFPVQLLAAISAAAVVKAIIPGNIRRVQTTLAPDVNVAQGLFLEMFLTSLLVFTVLMLAAEKWRATFVAPVGIGIALFIAELAGAVYTGASLNPVRSFAPCVVSPNFQSYHWIYWVGPLLGALLSGSYYHFVKFFNFWQANPGQDSGGGSWTPPMSPLLQMGHSPQQAAMQSTPSSRKTHAPANSTSTRSPTQRRPSSGSRDRGIARHDHYPRTHRGSDDHGRRQSDSLRRGDGRHARRYDRARSYDQGYDVSESERMRAAQAEGLGVSQHAGV
ncbi:Aquaporin-1 [Pseudocercospora fuligena]|uniref:Aquaporin-1 n=1 Tax=Pseudocercospora fuligena TaxID=685502 RepID=A0A8H6VNG2_9PEZI|nr:Aquaporin-1 [Pseudocercospora fuligena]